MSDKIIFRYDESFQSIIANNFKKLINEDEFYDVTLVSDDQIHFSAHKLVLSSSSSYFKNILKKTKHSHPLLCLDGIESSELKDVLQYIYNGEVNVNEKHIDRFLGIAVKLQLEGLSKNNRSEVELQSLRNKIQDIVVPAASSIEAEATKSSVMQEYTIKTENFDSGVNNDESESTIENSSTVNSEKGLQNYLSDTTLNADQIEQKLDEGYEKSTKDNLYHCKLCKRSARNKSMIREHVDTHYNFQYQCNGGSKDRLV